MPSRVITFVLAFVLLWSGLSTIEVVPAFAQPLPAQQNAAADASRHSDAQVGSVEDHHLDDLPSQVQTDPPTDTPGLLQAPLKPDAPALVTVQPHIVVSAAAGSPFLAGPLRPPCSAAFRG